MNAAAKLSAKQAGKLTPFGRRCRELRTENGYIMADQSKALDYSVPYISLIETGQKPVPRGYVQKLMVWLKLPEGEVRGLCDLVDAETKTIEFRPIDRDRALLARDLVLVLNLLGTLELAKLRKFMKEELLR